MVLFVYVDNSNVWIEGRRASAVAKGMAPNAWEAMNAGILDPTWNYDFGRLYQLACPADAQIGRSILIGSRPPPNDSLWHRARDEGFEVTVFDRNAANREKQVDTALVTVILEDSFLHMRAERDDTAVLVAGDGDYIPAVESLQARGLRARVVFWKHATNRDLMAVADEFEPLDPHLDFLAR